MMNFCSNIAFACCALLSIGSARAEMPPPTKEELAAWSAAYGEIEAMEPKWAVQGAEAFKALSEAGTPVIYLDVRTKAEWDMGIIEGAVTINLADLASEEGMARLPRSKTAIIAVYCKSGYRAALAVPLLHRYGYVNAMSMSGGYNSWLTSGYPIEHPGRQIQSK